MPPLKSPLTLLSLGAALLLGSPLIAMMPEFTPPDHCPPCANFPNVTYPFIPVGVSAGVIGLTLAILGYLRLRRVTHVSVTTWPLGFVGLVLILAGRFLMGYTVGGSGGWAIVLYQPQGVYLLALGLAVALYAILSIWTNWRSAVMLSVGIILTGYSLLGFAIEKSELELRCDIEVGCNPILAQSTVSGVIMLGLLLAFATFLLGLGTASFKKPIRREVL